MSEGKGWGSAEGEQRHLKLADALAPYRREAISTISDLAVAFTPEIPRILDLGCGTGDITASIIEYKPKAHAWMTETSDEMLRVVRKRFEGNPHIHIVKHDLNSPLPEDIRSQQFDVVVSSFAIHHVKTRNRMKLYSDIWAVLKDGGLFINCDFFKAESPDVVEWEFDTFIVQSIEKLMERPAIEDVSEEALAERHRGEDMGEEPCTIWQMEWDLREAGFIYVDCISKQGVLGIIAATK